MLARVTAKISEHRLMCHGNILKLLCLVIDYTIQSLSPGARSDIKEAVVAAQFNRRIRTLGGPEEFATDTRWSVTTMWHLQGPRFSRDSSKTDDLLGLVHEATRYSMIAPLLFTRLPCVRPLPILTNGTAPGPGGGARSTGRGGGRFAAFPVKRRPVPGTVPGTDRVEPLVPPSDSGRRNSAIYISASLDTLKEDGIVEESEVADSQSSQARKPELPNTPRAFGFAGSPSLPTTVPSAASAPAITTSSSEAQSRPAAEGKELPNNPSVFDIVDPSLLSAITDLSVASTTPTPTRGLKISAFKLQQKKQR
ncbi:hypothetical protein BDP27DRAFT_1375087 [Rhodocollybia butyracea]|uniref:Uncharacterized protein n=1 Tax=Rhodocollybia butyracea TaxID=206335 RepID=A0A9P5P1E1_9AGAR|nr:hypothetical protein BDP27DRAFT_1375087 [Rhodocollybia butyracea]